MQIKRYQLHNGRLPLLPMFLAGVLLGILMINIGKSILLEDTGLLDEYTLYHMKYMTVDSSALFYYILGMRIKSFILLVVLATTYLGLVVCAAAVLGCGFSVGAFLATLLIRYGLKGIIFATLSIFPQGLLYAPTLAALIMWCEKLNKGIYFKSGFVMEGEGMMPLPKRIVQLVVIFGLLLLGCIAESFINPKVMKWLLSIF